MNRFGYVTLAKENDRREFLKRSVRYLAGALCLGSLPRRAHAQTLLAMLEQSSCTLPVYFPIETFYIGRLIKPRSIIRIQINNFTTQSSRNSFLKKSSTEKDEIFPTREPTHEFMTMGKAPFGSAPTDSYKGLEQSGKLYLFKFRGSGDQLQQLKVSYRHIPEHGQVVKEEIGVIEYFAQMLEERIKPALEGCAT
jgi:hypothetical protein